MGVFEPVFIAKVFFWVLKMNNQELEEVKSDSQVTASLKKDKTVISLLSKLRFA